MDDRAVLCLWDEWGGREGKGREGKGKIPLIAPEVGCVSNLREKIPLNAQ